MTISVFKFIPGIVCPSLCLQYCHTEPSGNLSLKGRKTLRRQIPSQMTFVVVNKGQTRLEPDVRQIPLEGDFISPVY